MLFGLTLLFWHNICVLLANAKECDKELLGEHRRGRSYSKMCTDIQEGRIQFEETREKSESESDGETLYTEDEDESLLIGLTGLVLANH